MKREMPWGRRLERPLRPVVLTLFALLAVRALPEAKTLLIPPNAQEILAVLGPDAKGLDIPPEALPDLFTLTASRLEEDPKLFIVEQPYLGGRWEGGKAIIEYARDLSYTQVSIYDKAGRRQRIYSVRSRVEKRQDDAPKFKSLLDSANVGPAPDTAFAVPDQPRRRKRTPPAEKAAAAAPVPEASAPPATTAPAPPAPPPVTRVETAKAATDDEPVPADAPHYEWDEARAAYVPVKVTAVVINPEQPHRKTTVKTEPVVVAQAAPAAAQGARAATPPVEVMELHPAPASKGSDPWWASAVPGDSGKGSAAPASRSGAPKSAASVPARDPAAPVVESSVPSAEELIAQAEAPAKSPAAEAPPPSKAATKGSVAKAATPRARSTSSAEPPPEQVIVPSSDAYDLAFEEGPPAKSSKAAKKSPTSAGEDAIAKIDAAAAPASPPSADGNPETAVPLDSDRWTPKKGVVYEPQGTPVPDAPQVAMAPKPPVRDGSIENLMEIAAESKGAMPNEAAAWVPKSTTLPPPDVDIHEDLSRARKTKRPVPVVVESPAKHVSRDVNNPEEGVLPVNSFEKSSGGRYGRHREYERRLFFGKKPKAQIGPKEYDFYVEEVDRRKEYQNIYFYKHEAKGKPPRLVAVQKHASVTFLSNYDVDKTDKGKLTRY